MQPVLSVRGLTYAYDGCKHALDGVSIDVQAGEKIAVLGTNGAGKSTFFLCLNGVLEPHAGQILLHGRPVDARSRDALRQQVGVVFQNADDQIIASTVEAEISFGPMNLRLPRKEVVRRVDEAIQTMDLEAFRTRPPHYMSGGEKKRVSIADILAMESEVILFDEPAASLDPAGAEMLEQVLDSLGIFYEKRKIAAGKAQKGLAKMEKMVYSCLDSEPRHLEEIALRAGISVAQAAGILLDLELSGYAVRIGGSYYEAAGREDE